MICDVGMRGFERLETSCASAQCSSEAKQSARICQAASHGNFPFEKRIESLGQAVKACQRILMDSQNIGGIRKMLHQLRFTPCLSWLS